MTALAGPLHLLAVVLVVSGVGKLVDPWPATEAMGHARLPVPFRGRAVAGAALGAVEVAVGVAALAVPRWWTAAAVGVTFAAFAAFVIRLRRTDADAGCGCFGASSTPPGVAHVAINVVAAVVAAGVALAGVPDVVDVFDDGIGVAVPYVLLLAIGAGLVLVAPALVAERASARSSDRIRAFGPTTRQPAPRRSQ